MIFSEQCLESGDGRCNLNNTLELLCYNKENEVNKDCGLYDELLTNYNEAEEINSAVEVFPNPTSSVVNILPHGVDEWNNIQVINSMGVILVDSKFSYLLNLEGFADGIYTIKGYTNQGRYFMKKVVKLNSN